MVYVGTKYCKKLQKWGHGPVTHYVHHQVWGVTKGGQQNTVLQLLWLNDQGVVQMNPGCGFHEHALHSRWMRDGDMPLCPDGLKQLIDFIENMAFSLLAFGTLGLVFTKVYRGLPWESLSFSMNVSESVGFSDKILKQISLSYSTVCYIALGSP